MLNANIYNRAVGGETTATMDARWATDITPIKGVCKYAVIQGGINDIALADIQASITSMVNKATADGLIPAILNCTPTSSIAADPVKEQKRLDLNAWERTTFPNVIDIAQVIEDPLDKKFIRRTPGGSAGWYGDGVHYTRA
ncbi:SGNH/GDSL hydrolase family protein [Arthrobacter sp. D2-10]